MDKPKLPMNDWIDVPTEPGMWVWKRSTDGFETVLPVKELGYSGKLCAEVMMLVDDLPGKWRKTDDSCTAAEEIIEEVERLRQENKRLRKYCEACVEAGLSPEAEPK